MTLTILSSLLPSRASLKLALRCGILAALLLALCHGNGQVFAQTGQTPRPLETGKPIERELAGGQQHLYQLTLSVGQYLHVVVEQRGIDVVVTLFGPAGQKLVEVDRPNGTQGPEPVRWFVATTGLHRLEVRSSEKEAKPGRYEVELVELRAATSQDRDLAEAEKLYNESVSLHQKRQYNQAIPLAERALALREKALGAEHSGVAVSLNNLALLYDAMGNYAQAEPLYRRALVICEKVFGAEHPGTATSLHNLAALYDAKGEYTQAQMLYRRALAIREKVLGTEHPDTVTSLDSLATLYTAKGNYVQAEPLHQRALAIREKVLGAEHPATAASLNNLANLNITKGDYAQAEPLFRRALAIYEKVLGAEHPNTANSLNNLALLYEATGDIARALTFRSRSQVIEEHNIALNLASGSERRKIAYLKTLGYATAYSVRLHVRLAPANPTARDLALTAILQRKGRVLEALNDGTEALRRRAQPQERALLDQLKAERAQLAKLVLGGPQRVAPAEYRQAINRLEESVERLEAEISSRSLEFRIQSQPVTIAAVQRPFHLMPL